jgi:hypothetical protein
MRPTSSKQHRPPSARRRPQRSPLHISSLDTHSHNYFSTVPPRATVNL